MSFKDCLVSAQQQGAITAEEARDLGDRFDELHAQARLDLGDGAAAAAAKQKLEAQVRIEAAQKRRILGLTEQARARIVRDITGYRTPKGEADILEGVLGLFEHFGFHGYSSVEGRFKSIVGMAHAEMEEALKAFDRTWATGRRQNRARLENVIRELHGEGTGDEAAKAIAQTFDRVSEALRQRFNASGGDIPRLENWGGPQYHDAVAVLRAGRDSWKDAIRGRLDSARMRDPLTGEAPTPARLEQLLDGAYDSIVSNGDIRLRPGKQRSGSGALYNQRAEHRFFAFKSADDWLSYAQAFGQGDPFVALMNHVKGMSRDIAALEVLGPNPSATVEWLKQVVELEAANKVTGRPSSFGEGKVADIQAQAGLPSWRIETLWNGVRGGEVVSGKMAAGFASIRNFITSAVLGSAAVTAIATDPLIANVAKRMSGLPTSNLLTEIFKTLKFSSDEAVRAGLIWEDALHMMGQEARYAGTLAGPRWTRYIADRVLAWSGLTPWTQARKHLFGMEFQAFVADNHGAAWDALPDRLRRTMAGYGIDATDWAVMQSAGLYQPRPGKPGFLRPAEIAAIADGPALDRVVKPLGITEADQALRLELARRGVTRTAEKYLEMIISETERAVPSGTKRASSLMAGGAPTGTIAGEFLRGALMFKSFGLSFTMLQSQALAREVADFGMARGAAYAGHMAIALTIGGAIATQLKQIVNGKDFQDPKDPKFWIQSAATGGGFGLFGDFLLADVNRFGHTLGEQLAGPIVGMGSDFLKFGPGNVQKLLKGEDTSVGEDLVRLGRRYMPTASLWYMRQAYDRVLFDQLQYLADPEAHRSMRDQEKRLARETGQGYWWKPGELAPSRLPTTSTAP